MKSGKAPKIAFVSSYPHHWFAGCEDLWSESALRLVKAGVAVYANINAQEAHLPQMRRLAAAGVAVSARPSGRCSRMLRRLQMRPVGRGWLKQIRPALVVVSEGDSFEGAFWAESCAALRIPFVFICHACTPWQWPDDTRFPLMRDIYTKATAAYFVCNENRVLFESKIATPLPQAKIVRNPFRVDYDANLVWPPESPFRIACVGAADISRKGQDIALRVLSGQKWRDRAVEVTLFCHGGGKQNVVRSMIASLPLKRVSVITNVTDAAAIWAEHHALLLPSRREGLPLTLVEAMLCGRVPIITDVGGHAEVVTDEVNGFIAKAPSDSSLDDALERAWTRRAEWQAIGQTAKQTIRAIIPPDPVQPFADELAELLQQTP